ncbi:MAG: peptidoglycan endopeptidase [Bacteroidetes bacterium]|nr:MAG: peptidoglycan endopeptidase [Bacteroidota bacterium]
MRKDRLSTSFSLTLTGIVLVFFSSCFASRESSRPSATGSSAERQLRTDVASYALQFQGTRYKYAGKNPRTGFDCSGFTSFVLQKFDIPLSSASAAQATAGKPVSLSQVQPGDLIIFGKSRGKTQHVAMVVERNSQGIIVVHSTTSRGVIRENISTSSYWKPRIRQARNVISSNM